MSAYQNFVRNNIFNSSEIITQDEVSNGRATISLDLSSFVTKDNPVFTKSIFLANPNEGLNFQGTVQRIPFSAAEKLTVDNAKNDLTNIKYINNITEITGDLNLTLSNLLLTNESIAINKITNLTSTLTGIQTNLTQIHNNDDDILNLQTENLTQNVKLNDLEISSLAHTNSIIDIENDITNNVNVNIFNNTSNIFNNTNDIADNVIEINNNKLNIENNDVEILTLQTDSAQLQIDVTNNLNTFNTQKGITDLHSNSVDTTLLNHSNSILSINTLNAEQTLEIDQNKIDILSNENNIATNTININQHNIDINNNITNIDALINQQNINNNSITNLNGLSATNSSNISTLNTQVNNHTTNLSSLDTNILLKQDKLTALNRLNVSYIGNGDLNASKLSSLNDIRTDVSIQNQLNVMQSELDLFDGNNVVLNSNRLSAVENNILLKQDIINDDDLNILHILGLQSNLNTLSTNIASNVTNITTTNNNIDLLVSADVIINNQINDLQSADVVLQDNINLKQNIITLLNSDKIFDVTMNDTLNNLLNILDTNISTLEISKQIKFTTLNKLPSSLINRNDNLQYVDVSSSIQSQIDTLNSNITNKHEASINTNTANITNNLNAIST